MTSVTGIRRFSLRTSWILRRGEMSCGANTTAVAGEPGTSGEPRSVLLVMRRRQAACRRQAGLRLVASWQDHKFRRVYFYN